MKIGIITQSLSFLENKRITDEAAALGHDCKMIDIKEIVMEMGGDDTSSEGNGVFVDGENLLKYDLIIFRSVFSSSKKAIALIRYFRSSGVKVFDNNLEKTSYNIDKVRDGVIFHTSGLLYPKTIIATEEDDFRESCEELGYPVIVKHVGQGQGVGVFKFDDTEAVDDFIEGLKEEGKKLKNYMIQEMIPYVQDLRVLVIGGEVIGVMQRIPQEGEFRANFSRGGSVKFIDTDPEVKAMAEKASKATMALNAGVDVLVTEDGKKYILEVNRTPGFEGFEKASQLNIAKLVLEEALQSAY